jgi:REP element-mobilizing transposase RayT
VYNRGVNREPVFLERENYLFFLRRYRQDVASQGTDLIAYCLLPNHYHLLVYLVATDDFGRLMQPFALSYTKAMNKRYGRVGPLFQGRFCAVHVDREEYLLHLSRYIHLNAVRAGLVHMPQDWEFSSYREYVGLRQGTLPKPEVVLAHFRSREAYREFVEREIETDDRIIRHLLFE